MSVIIKVNNLSFGYNESRILEGLDFEVTQGTFLAIAGPNGAGKTTLLNLLCGLLKPASGRVQIDSKRLKSYSIRDLAKTIAVVRQEFVPIFDFTVAETVLMARIPYLPTLGFESETDRQFVNKALEMTDTLQFASRPLASLSGGERQRVFIARALAQNTAILLLDEPTSFLDLKHQVQIYDILKRMQREHSRTIVAVTHDINLAAQYADKVLLLATDNSYLMGDPEEVFCPEQIEKVFGVKTFAGNIGRQKFFVPLGQFAKDAQPLNTNTKGVKQKE